MAPYKPARRQRGSVYLMVLAVGLNILVIALAALALSRIRLARIQSQQDLQTAQRLASSALAQALGIINDPDTRDTWRSTYVNGVENTVPCLGPGQMSFRFIDDDNDLTDQATDPLWIQGIGRVGSATWVEQAQAKIQGGSPLSCLGMALHSAGKVVVQVGQELTVEGAPVSTDTKLVVNGFLVGDANVIASSGIGFDEGTITITDQPKGVPFSSVFNDYVARAATLPFNGDLDQVVIAPGINEYGGGLNHDGIYYLNTGGNPLIIKDTRLYGTLVIDASGSTVTIDNTNFMAPYRSYCPVLIIKGDLISSMATGDLKEFAGHNYNPAGAPYLGITDSDEYDTYPNAIQGLVHVIGNVTFKDTANLYQGAVVASRSVTVFGRVVIDYDSQLPLNPPLGYTADSNSTEMILQPDTYARQPAF